MMRVSNVGFVHTWNPAMYQDLTCCSSTPLSRRPSVRGSGFRTFIQACIYGHHSRESLTEAQRMWARQNGEPLGEPIPPLETFAQKTSKSEKGEIIHKWQKGVGFCSAPGCSQPRPLRRPSRALPDNQGYGFQNEMKTVSSSCFGVWSLS